MSCLGQKRKEKEKRIKILNEEEITEGLRMKKVSSQGPDFISPSFCELAFFAFQNGFLKLMMC